MGSCRSSLHARCEGGASPPGVLGEGGGDVCCVGEDLKLAAEMVERSLEQEPDNTAFLRIQLDIYDTAGMHAQRCTHGAAYSSDRPGCG